MMKLYRQVGLCTMLSLAVTMTAQDFTYEGINYTVLDAAAKTVQTKAGATDTSGNNVSGEIELPATVTYNGEQYTLTSIGENSFLNNTALTQITLPSTITTIGDGAFAKTGLTSIDIPASVTSIQANTFSDCTSLTSVVIPERVTSIGNYAFIRCTALESVFLPASVSSVDPLVFLGCSALKKCAYSSALATNPFDLDGLTATVIEYPASGTEVDDEGFVWSADHSTLYYVPMTCEGEQGEYTVSSTVSTIGPNAFAYCTELTSVTVPETVTTIGNGAFSRSGLVSMTWPESVTVINNDVFSDCPDLETVAIPSTVTSIGNYSFIRCNSLESIVIPPSVTSIDPMAFYGCENLKKCAYPSSLSSPFSGVTYLIDYPVENTVVENGYVWAADKSALYFVPMDYEGEFVIPATVASIGKYACALCTEMTSVTIPEATATIGSQAFAECDKLFFVIVNRSFPPTAADDTFSETTYQNAWLRVPEQSYLTPPSDLEGKKPFAMGSGEELLRYLLATCWKNFQYLEGTMTGIETMPEQTRRVVARYTGEGLPADASYTGIVIECYSDGSRACVIQR